MLKMKWYLQRWARVLGWPGGLGIVLLVVILLIGLVTLIPAQSKLTELGRQAKTTVDKARMAPKNDVSNEAPSLEKFKTLFPDWSDMPKTMTKVYAIAKAENVNLEQGDGLVIEEQSRDLLRYELTFPVTAGYVQIRNFMTKLVEEIPAAAVDEMKFKRDAINNTSVNAEIRITLYFKNA